MIDKNITTRNRFARSNYLKGNLRGFTLLETMVAIAILLIAVVGPISLIGDSLHKLYFAKDEIIALNLAQEGVELIRATGASSMLQGQNISQKIMQGAVGPTPAVRFVADVDSITAAGKPDKALLGCDSACFANYQSVYLDSNGLYRQENGSPASGWTKTQFKRLITATEIAATREIKIESNVTWSTGGQQGTITVMESIFNWAP